RRVRRAGAGRQAAFDRDRQRLLRRIRHPRSRRGRARRAASRPQGPGGGRRAAIAAARRPGALAPAGASPRGPRHRVLIPAFAGSNPAAPAIHPLHPSRPEMRTNHMKEDRNILIFSGNANRPLTQAVCRQLGTRQGKALVSKFSDGEVQVEIEENVRRQEVFVLQSTCAPAAEHLVELTVLVDALTRASAASVTAVIPYFGYARQDRRLRSSRVPITAKV